MRRVTQDGKPVGRHSRPQPHKHAENARKSAEKTGKNRLTSADYRVIMSLLSAGRRVCVARDT